MWWSDTTNNYLQLHPLAHLFSFNIHFNHILVLTYCYLFVDHVLL